MMKRLTILLALLTAIAASAWARDSLLINHANSDWKIAVIDQEEEFSFQTWTTNSKELSLDNWDLEIKEAPQGTSFDDQTGKISWTPEEAGVYTFSIELADKSGQSQSIAKLSWETAVGSCKSPGQTLFAVEGKSNAMNLAIKTGYRSNAYNQNLIKHTLNPNGRELLITSYEEQDFDIYMSYLEADTRIMRQGYVTALDPLSLTGSRDSAIVFGTDCGTIDSLYYINIEKGSLPQDTLNITVNNDSSIKVGEEHTFVLMANIYKADELEWTAIELPKDAELSDFGVVTFTPEEEGVFNFSVKGQHKQNGDYDIVEWAAVAEKCPEGRYLTVELTKNGQPLVERAIIHLYENGDKEGRQVGYPTGSNTYKVNGGEVILGVEIPTYDLQLESPDMLYSGYATKLNQAFTIEIDCDETETYTLELDNYMADPIEISGYIYDKDTQEQLTGSVNLFCSGGKYYGENFTFGAYRNYEFLVRVPEGMTWVARAWSMMPDSNNQGDIYPMMYYLGQTNFFEADEINGNVKQNLQIPLEKAKDRSVTLGGLVVDIQDNPIPYATITAYLVGGDKNNDEFKYRAFSTMADRAGVWVMPELLAGEYVIHIYSPRYTSGYWNGYGKGISFEWEKTKRVEANINDEILNLTAELPPLPPRIGSARIKGNTGRGGLVQTEDNTQEENSVSGVFMTLLNSESETIMTSFSDNAGDFSIDDLEAGTYFLIADKPGYVAMTRQIEIAAGEEFEAEMEMSPWQSVRSLDEAGYRIFPNPSSIEARISGIGEGATISLISTDGARIIADYSISAGEAVINTQGLATGQYMILLQDGGAIYKGKLMVK